MKESIFKVVDKDAENTARYEQKKAEFMQDVENIAKGFGVDVNEVILRYALALALPPDSENVLSEIIGKTFHNQPLLDLSGKQVVTELYADTVNDRLNKEIADKDTKLAAAEKAATIDVLTGLPNRRALENKLQEMIANYKESKTLFSVIILDIDNFKEINDKFGHTIGDSVLREIGATIRHNIREPDFAARYGGEEIAIVVEASGDKVLNLVVERIDAAIKGIDTKKISNDPKFRNQITASFGFAEYIPETQNIPGEDVVSRADKVMYNNKEVKKSTNPASLI